VSAHPLSVPFSALGLVVFGLALTGCMDPKFEALTAPPPTGVAELDRDANSIRLSHGVALAFDCTFGSAPCESASAESSDASVVSIRAAATDQLAYGGLSGEQPQTIFVIVGEAQGTATLTVHTADGDATLDVGVEP